MRQPFATLIAGAAMALAAGTSSAQQHDLTIVSWGGAYQDGQKEVFFKPFNATGTKLVDEAWDGGLGVLRARAMGALAAGAAAQLCVRPERLHLGDEGDNRFEATLVDAIHQGDHWRVVARLAGLDATWFAKIAPRTLHGLALEPGRRITLSFGHDDAWLFPA